MHRFETRQREANEHRAGHYEFLIDGIDADDEAATLGAGTRSIQGNLLIAFITNLGASLPLHWIEYAANKTPDGSTFTVVFNAEGILQATDG